MRRFLVLPILPALLLSAAYAVWPAWSAWQLRAAVKMRDIPAIERKVDWPALRASLKQTVNANLADERKSPDAGVFTKALKRALGPLVANRVIDAAVTPQTLVHVLAGRVLFKDIVRTTPGREGEGNAEDSDPLAPRRLRWAFFDSPTRFRIEVADAKEPHRRVISVLELQGLSWKLVDVYYRSPA